MAVLFDHYAADAISLSRHKDGVRVVATITSGDYEASSVGEDVQETVGHALDTWRRQQGGKRTAKAAKVVK